MLNTAIAPRLQVPSRPDAHMLRGCKYTAAGTQMQLLQLAAKLLNQALAPAAFEPDAELKQWCYLNDQVSGSCCTLQAVLSCSSGLLAGKKPTKCCRFSVMLTALQCVLAAACTSNGCPASNTLMADMLPGLPQCTPQCTTNMRLFWDKTGPSLKSSA